MGFLPRFAASSDDPCHTTNQVYPPPRLRRQQFRRLVLVLSIDVEVAGEALKIYFLDVRE